MGSFPVWNKFHSLQPSLHAKERVAQVTSIHFISASCLHSSYMESCPHSHSAPPCRTWPTWWLYRIEARCWRRCLTAATGPRPPGIPSRRPCRPRWTGSTPLVPSCNECARSSPSTRGRSENCHERWRSSLMPDAGDLLSRGRGEEEDWRCQKGSTLRCGCHQTAEKKKYKRLKETNWEDSKTKLLDQRWLRWMEGCLFLCLILMLGTAQCHENKVSELKHNLSLVVRKTTRGSVYHMEVQINVFTALTNILSTYILCQSHIR